MEDFDTLHNFYKSLDFDTIISCNNNYTYLDLITILLKKRDVVDHKNFIKTLKEIYNCTKEITKPVPLINIE